MFGVTVCYPSDWTERFERFLTIKQLRSLHRDKNLRLLSVRVHFENATGDVNFDKEKPHAGNGGG